MREYFQKLVQNLAYSLNVGLAGVSGIDYDFIQVYNNKNI